MKKETSTSIYADIEMIPPRITYQMHRIGINKRTGRPYTYRSQAQKEACKAIEAALRPYVPAEPMTGPLAVSAVFRFPHNKSASKTERAAAEVPMTSRPDADNLWKQWSDTMTALGFWEDDSQVVSLSVKKVKSNRPGITLQISPY